MAESTANRVSQVSVHEPAKNERFNMAKWVLVFGLVAVSALGIAAIAFAAIWGSPDEVFSNVKDILIMVLPLIGAWVGTVLAFYFSKDNFKAASDSTKELLNTFRSTEDKLKAISVAEAMIKTDTMVKLVLDKDAKLIKLKADLIDGILEKDKKKSFNRLPVLTDKMLPKYVIHRSLFDKYFYKMILNNAKIEDLTLADMLNDPDFGSLLTKSFGTIKLDSNLAEVKHLIDNIPECQDVFVTDSGTPDSKVTGWITNVIVAKASVI